MTTTYCDSGAVKLKAGSIATVLTDDQYTQLINQAECMINTEMQIDYLTAFAALEAGVKSIFEDAASSYAACSVVTWDIGAFATRATAQTILDVNWAKYREAIKLLKEKGATDFIDTPITP